MGNKVNFVAAWSKFWGSVGGNTNFWTAMAVIGMLVVIVGVIGLAWQKRRGGGNHTPLIWGIIVGSILAGPNLVIPVILGIIDLLANLIVKMVKSWGLAG